MTTVLMYGKKDLLPDLRSGDKYEPLVLTLN